MVIKISKYLLLLGTVYLIACSSPDDVAYIEKTKKDSVKAVTAQENNATKTYDQLVEKPGVVGVFDVPEMLTICRKDSAKAEDMASAFAKNYAMLEADLKYLGMKSDGAAGSIYYNNDPSNFIFECVYPISEIPKKKPKDSQIVALEASHMLIYNYFGDYRNLYKAYDEIKHHISENNLEQSGPLREFYITDPIKVKDTAKWMTRIMVPVMAKKKKNS